VLNAQIDVITKAFASGKRVAFSVRKGGFYETASGAKDALSQEELTDNIIAFVQETAQVLDSGKLGGLHKALESRKRDLESRENGFLFKAFAGKKARQIIANAKNALNQIDQKITVQINKKQTQAMASEENEKQFKVDTSSTQSATKQDQITRPRPPPPPSGLKS
jgi:hypothetical protein